MKQITLPRRTKLLKVRILKKKKSLQRTYWFLYNHTWHFNRPLKCMCTNIYKHKFDQAICAICTFATSAHSEKKCTSWGFHKSLENVNQYTVYQYNDIQGGEITQWNRENLNRLAVSTFGNIWPEKQGSFESSHSTIWSGFDPIVALEQTKFHLRFKYYVPPLSQWEQWYKQGNFCLFLSPFFCKYFNSLMRTTLTG